MDITRIMISFVEMLGILLIYNTLINNNLLERIGINILTAIVTSALYTFLVTIYSTDQILALVSAIFINSILIAKLEEKDTILVLVEVMISGLIILILELFTTFIIHILIGESDVNTITYLLLISSIMFFLIFLLRVVLKDKTIKLSDFLAKYRGINIIILNLFVFFMFIKILAVNDLIRTNIVVHVTILGLILVGVNCYFYIYLYKTLNDKKKREIKTSFNPLINDLMVKVKANEHEYKNHLNTIWSIAQVSNKDEIKDKIKDYISNIIDESEEFSMLLNIDNTIIKAVLYNKGQRAEKLGVKYNYTVTSDLKDITLDNAELTVVLSNLLNNAIEATSMIENKEVQILIEEDNKNYIIEVKNYSKGITPEMLTSIFKMGYTTKGEGRGYGLYNVKKIIDKHKGKIQVGIENDIVNIKILFSK